MNTRIASPLLVALLTFAVMAESHAQSTAFTYQGRLTSGGSPASGSYDFQFTLFGAESGGNPKGGPLTVPAVGVTNGLFTVPLDFGAAVFNGADRWLDIAVRPVGGGTFTPLDPRQPIIPTPYAVTALFAKQVPGVSGNALHAADGNPQNAVFVDTAGNVGVGTTSPQEKLDVRSGDGSYVRVDNVNGDIKVNGGSDGHFGIFNDGPSSGGTHLIGQGQSRFFVANTGNVGISTTTPTAKLEVRGDIRMGPGGELRAAGGEENLRIVRGVIDGGNIIAGSGFSVSRNAVGAYEVTFNPPFASAPTVTATVQIKLDFFPADVKIGGDPTPSRVILLVDDSTTTDRVDRRVQFIAIGPR